jgi:type II secretory pathway pseudopilin PulG
MSSFRRSQQNLRSHGLSLLEVVLVLALAMAAAAALLPRLLRSRILANEGTAISNVDVITLAQESYRSTYPAIGYASSLADMALMCHRDCVPSPQHACLIDCNLPAATTSARDGYTYALAVDPSAGAHGTYVVAVSAAIPMHTGDHDFCAIEDGKVRYRTASGQPPAQISHDLCRTWPVMP